MFSQGDAGDNFYILLEGKVKLLTWAEGDQGEEQTEIAQLAPGQSFGELSLIKNRPRNATVICMQSCYFMTLSKDNYLRLLGKSVLKLLEDKIEFLHSLQMFNNWSKRSIEKLSYAFELKSFKHNEIIYQEGECSIGAYVVIKGEVELTATNRVEKDLPRKLMVALIGEKDFFGDEELLIEAPRKYSARCSSKVLSAYFILKPDFFQKINSESISCLVRANNIRNRIRETRLNSVKKYKHFNIISATPELPKKKGSRFTFIHRKKQTCKPAYRNLCLSEILMKTIKKRSLFNVNSPTASILISNSIYKRPRSVNTFFITKGFQPKNGLPSGIFQRMQNRIRDL